MLLRAFSAGASAMVACIVPERLEALAYVVLLAVLVRASIERRARRYAEATGEELPIPGKRTSTQPTARIILDSFEPIIVVIMPDGTRPLAESRPVSR